MPLPRPSRIAARVAAFFCFALAAFADPREIPVPAIGPAPADTPGPDALPDRPEPPALLVRADGSPISTAADWPRRREEWRVVLENYAVGRMPPAPARVVARELKSAPVLGGEASYRLVRLSFGPAPDRETLGFDIAIFTPANLDAPCPVVVFPSFDPTPGGSLLPRLPRPPGQGKGVNALLPVEPLPAATPQSPPADHVAPDPETVASRHRELLRRGYALVTYHYQDTGEDTTLRLTDGSWAYRTTRFFPAYPEHDWGLLGAWAWGMSRVADYLVTQPFADASRLVVTGHSRLGKAALVAGAFDERFALVAPAGTGGGGNGLYRRSGAGRGGKEGLDEMMKKYPGWFGPRLHAFRGRAERLPFDQHAFVGLVAPRAFLALEATQDPVSLPSAVVATLDGARPVFALLGVEEQLGANFASHGHAYAPEDWAALLDFADWRLRDRDSGRRFPLAPPASPSPSPAPSTPLPAPRSISVRDFGALGDGATKDTAALQRALDACAVAGGGEVLVPAGTYLIGSVQLGARTTLRLAEGAVLRGSPDLADYPLTEIRWEGRLQPGHRSLIHAAHADHVAIVGPGRIEGDASVAASNRQPRGALIVEFIHCRDVRWEDFSVHQPGNNWATHPTFCTDVVIRNLRITGERDGIDVDSCENVRIEGCHIDTGDDCISLKSGRGLDGARLGKPVADVVIADSTFIGRHFACIGIGSEISAGVRDVRIERCRFTAKTAAIYLKSRIGRAGLSENITATDLDVLGGGFLRINLVSAGNTNTADDPVPGEAGYPEARALNFSKVRLRDAAYVVEATKISPERPLRGLVLRDIAGSAKRGAAIAHVRDLVWENVAVSVAEGPLQSFENVAGPGLAEAETPTARVAP